MVRERVRGGGRADSIFFFCPFRLCLGDLYSKTDRIERAKECLFYALELEDTQPIQPFSILPRCT